MKYIVTHSVFLVDGVCLQTQDLLLLVWLQINQLYDQTGNNAGDVMSPIKTNCNLCFAIHIYSTVLIDGMMERRNILIQEGATYFRWIDAQGHDVISSRTCSIALVVGVVVVELSVSRFVDVARHGSFDGERARL